MSVTTIAGTSGGEGSRLARILAAHATTLPSHLLHPTRSAIPFAPPNGVTVIPIDGDGGAFDAGILRALERVGPAAVTFIELPVGHAWSSELVAVSSIALVPAAPGQVSIAEALRAIRQIEFAREMLPEGCSAAPWLIGWESVGGPAAGDRLRAGAERAIRRDPTLAVDIEELLLPWGVPPLHWSEVDYLFGLANRPTDSRIDDVVKILRGLWMSMSAQPSEKILEVFSRDLSDLAAGEPHSDGARIGLLSHDLHMIAAGLAPSQADLHHAPQLMSWRIHPILSSSMRGKVRGHPRLANGKEIVTSPLMMIDPRQMWCRTTSRFYGLGRPDPSGPQIELARLFISSSPPDTDQTH